MHVIDLGIIAAYFVFIIAITIFVMRTTRTGDDLFLAGRSLGWGVIGFSLFASNISSTTLIGLSGAAFTDGLAISNYEWMAGLVLVFMSFFVIPVFLRKKITTVPEYLGERYNGFCRKYFSGLTILMSIIVDTAGGIFAGALVVQLFFPDIPFQATCVAIAVFAGFYTAAGGLRAVVYTDVLQAIILLIGSAAITFYVFSEFDFSWAQAKAAIPEGHLSLIRPMDDPMLPGLGTLIGVPILGFWYWATNQYITQRILGARDLEQARLGAVLAGFLKILPLFIMVLPGAMALGLYETIGNPDQIFPKLVQDYLPIGFKGIVIAGLFAAIMSTIDSTLNSASTLIIKDFVEPAKKDPLTPKEEGRWGRFVTLILMVCAAIWAPQIAHFKGLFAYLQQAFSIVVPPVVTVFMLGLFWRGATAKAATVTLLSGHVLGLGFFVAGQLDLWQLHYTITVGIVTGICMAVMLIASYATRRSNVERPDVAWRRSDCAPTMTLGWAHDYRVYAVIVLILTAIMLSLFW